MTRLTPSWLVATALLVAMVHCKPTKELELEEARALAEDILGALSTDKAAAAIAAAAPTTDAEDMQARLAAILPVADALTKDVRAKYDVGSTLEDAMTAAGQAGQTAMDSRPELSRKLSDTIQMVSEIIIGEESPRRIGRVRSLDVLADGFVALDSAGRTERVNKAVGILKSFDSESISLSGKAAGATTYLEAMRGIVADGDDFVIDQVVQAVVLLGPDMDEEGAKSTNETRKELHIRLNVLSEFLGMEDGARVGDKVEAAMKALAEGHAGKEEL